MVSGDALDSEAAASSKPSASEAASSHPGWLREESERRLLSLCRRLVVDAASDAWSHHGAATSDTGLGTTPDGTSWDQVRWSLLLHAHVYRQMDSGGLQTIFANECCLVLTLATYST